MAGNPDFNLFALNEEHDELRAAIRGLSEKEIAPYAKDVDENARFPRKRSPLSTRPASTPSTFPRLTTARAPIPSPPASSSRKSPASVDPPR